MDDRLVLGPLLRYVDETSAAVWVETSASAKVCVRAAADEWTAATFAVHGHHYALVEVDGLEPGSIQIYTVEIDGTRVWPPEDSTLPPSRIATLEPGQELRMAFGSCRVSLPHDAEANEEHGVDALRAYARHMASGDADKWPDLVLFLGDQVYADETSEEMQAFIASRRSLDEPPGTELRDFEEYTHLYRLAWADRTNRWLLSTLPSAMIFDDHDIRDDWNTSAQWRREMAGVPWWHDRIVGGLASYWIYQHLGNLSPQERAKDEIWSQIFAGSGSDEQRDWGPVLDAFAERADEHPDTYRWSFVRDIGANRVIVVDSRAARVLQPSVRSILDDAEMAWLDEQMRGGFSHVFVGTSLPFMLSRGLHYFEAWSEAVASGAWGKRAAVAGEKIRRAVDLEHWAAFHDGFQQVAAMTVEVATGKRGEIPGSVTFLSGDVHHSYIAEAKVEGECRVLQAVCSPIRNRLPGKVRFGMAALAHGAFTPIT
ncbi:MAG: alkaline phosphatase family protein, partial [Actinomycetota bacterium]|nr:alkaline phosphatase family protein [Actinomycetota bacterium]